MFWFYFEPVLLKENHLTWFFSTLRKVLLYILKIVNSSVKDELTPENQVPTLVDCLIYFLKSGSLVSEEVRIIET